MTTFAKLPISAFIICKNEEDRIITAINSVQDWVDEVIVIDSGSTDQTVALAKETKASVFYNEWHGYGKQKRFAEEKCRNIWLLNIDADEEITPQLANEIQDIFSNGPKADIYKVDIVDIFPHEKITRKWAYGYKQYRLYNRNKGSFSESAVHDTVRPNKDAIISVLNNKINHRSHRNIQFSIEKMNKYSEMQVNDMIARNRKISKFRLLYDFPVSFFKVYFIRLYFLYGWWGLIIAHNYAYSRFIRIAKFYEKQINTDNTNGIKD